MKFDTSETRKKWRNKIDYAKRNFKNDRLIQEYKSVMVEVDSLKVDLEKQAEERLKFIENELSSMVQPQEPTRGKLDMEQITILNYYSKILKSRLAIEGNTQAGFLKVLQEIAELNKNEPLSEQKNQTLKWVLLDNMHEVIAAARELTSREEAIASSLLRESGAFKSWEAFESQIREQFQLTKNSLRDPKEVEQDKANTLRIQDLKNEKKNMRSPLLQEQGYLESFKAGVERDLYMIDDTYGSDPSETFFK